MTASPALRDAARPFSPSAVTDLLPPRTRVLALGEPTHGVEAFLDLRNELFRHLVAEHGYRSIAVESDCLAALGIDAYLGGADGDLDTVVREGFGHGFGDFPGNRELVRWMREFNSGVAESERLRLYGADGPLEMTAAAPPGPSLLRLHEFLAAHLRPELLPPREELTRLHGPDARWTEPAAALDPARSVGRTDEAVQLRLLADELTTLLAASAPQLAGEAEPEKYWQAGLHARTATGLLRYHAAMAGAGPDRFNSLMRQRDLMMADNLDAIVRREAERGPTLVFAHNRHLQREAGRIRLGAHDLLWWSAGSLLATRLGDGYAFVATAFGHRGADDHPAPDTLEGLLATLPEPRLTVDPRLLAAATEGRAKARVPADHTYFGLDPEALELVDGVVFVREIPRQSGPFGG
ncbi:erythromycin esterase family protein [Kitasatospora cheerisanensis]|uniref:Erythromycin esterase n=1 Tax=Kitasatospora cheerisanensis KCTC 2395 TaxID=1348663 RepID=A0A066YYZ1_9ACTN|nr:erythromycin esterase family protein [Kitasatospora cheerisanensis]KDN86748.1 erythromycin esterase [Kitasatospora cheerisanensis KCTC 2395]